jgi:hypothetical protein
MVGEAIDVWLRPFEVAMWEVVPEDDPRVATYRPLPVDAAHVSHRLAFAPTQPMPDLVMEFGDPTPYFRSTRRRPTLAEYARLGYHKRVLAWEATIPQLATGGHVLAIIVRMHQDGQPWRHPQPADLMQMRGMVGDRLIRFEPVPNFRQTENNQRAHWLVFKIRTASTWAGKLFHCVMTTYLPPSVILEEEGWIVPEWRAE